MTTIRNQFGSIKMTHRLQTWDHGIIQEVLADYPLSKCKIDTENPIIFDIGAHIGTFSVLSRHLFPNAVIIAVEPDTENFKLLIENASKSLTYRCAIGDPAIGVLRLVRYRRNFQHAPQPGQSPSEWGRNTGGSYTTKGNSEIQEGMKDAEETPVMSLGQIYKQITSNLISLKPKPSIDILKLDCEGAEADALRHAGIPLANIKYIIGEVHGADLQIEMQGILEDTHKIEFSKPGTNLSDFFAKPL